MHAALAAAYGQLGERDAAAQGPAGSAHTAAGLRRHRPQRTFEKWWEPEFVEHLHRRPAQGGAGDCRREGRRHRRARTPPFCAAGSGAVRADEGFWVAVLPFKYSGASADLAALAEGLTEDIVTGLSRFSYLRVIARSSTRATPASAADVRSVGRELGARYVMEGSLRQAGRQLRVAVQLVDAVSGAHLWAETYDAPFSPDADLRAAGRPRAADRLDRRRRARRPAAQHERSAPEQVSGRAEPVRGGAAQLRVSATGITPEEHAVVRAGLERAVERGAGNADAWAHAVAASTRTSMRRDSTRGPIPSAAPSQAARRAVDAAPSNHLAYQRPGRGAVLPQGDSRRSAPRPSGPSRSTRWTVSTLAGLGCLIAYRGRLGARLRPRRAGDATAIPIIPAGTG